MFTKSDFKFEFKYTPKFGGEQTFKIGGFGIDEVMGVDLAESAAQQANEKLKRIIPFLRDYFEMTKYAMWFNEIGEKKAYEVAEQIQKGKYGSNEGVHVQMNKLLKQLESSDEQR